MTRRGKRAATATVDTPLGRLGLEAEGGALVAIRFGRPGERACAPPERGPEAAVLREAASQLEAFFAGRRASLELPLAPRGTPFQRAVWAAVAAIPAGETRTYGELATALGRPRAARAVGAANGANPLALAVPCHRVIGSNGALTGYAWGLEKKRWLLDHERALTARPEPAARRRP